MQNGALMAAILAAAFLTAGVGIFAGAAPAAGGAAGGGTKPALCMARYVPERADDIFWENDRTAHRIYGPALATDPKGPPMSSSGIDIWVKSVRTLFMDKALQMEKAGQGSYHAFNGEGMDCYDTGTTRGCGGLGIWDDAAGKLMCSGNWADKGITQNGPDVASFWVTYADWDVGGGRKVKEKRTFTLPAGSNLTRLVSTFDSDKPGELLVGIGITKRIADGRKFSGPDKWIMDKDKGVFAYWEPVQSGGKGTIGVGVLIDPKSIVKFVTDDPGQNLVIVRQTAGKPWVYYVGACWDKGLDFHSEAEWEAYLRAYKSDFDAAK